MVTQFAPSTIPVVGRPFGLGKVFYVNHFAPGDDGNNGIDPLTPFRTITHALSQCVANRNDYIVVLDSWAETTETWPIPVSVDRVHIIGMACPNAPYTKIRPPDASNTAVMSVTGDYVEIAGFDFGSGDDHGSLELDQGRNCWIHHCQFGSVEANRAGGLPNYGIWVHADSNTFCLIELCRFLGQDGNAGGTIGIDGITTVNPPGAVSFSWSVIRNCVFQGLPGHGIYIHLTIAMVIQDNIFALDADTQGAAITLAQLGGVTHGNFVVGNKAIYGLGGDMVQNPYLDENAAGENHWVANYKGLAPVDPAVTGP